MRHFVEFLTTKTKQHKSNSSVNKDEEAVKVTPRGKHGIEISTNSLRIWD